MPVDQLANIKMSRLRLTLVDGHRVNPTAWTPESKQCQRHPAWPGGNYQHELVWAYAEDGTTRPTWILLPHPTQNNQYILCNNNTSHQYGSWQGEQFTLLMPLPKIFFYEAHRRHPDRSLTTPSSLLKYAIPGDTDKPYLPQLHERPPEAAPVTPRKPPPDEQGDPLPPPEALAPVKVEEVPEDARMPHTPVCNEMYEASLMNPSAADRIWYTHRCNLKLAVTMFNVFYSAGARDKWSQSPIKETKMKLYNTLYTRKPREIPTSHSENPNQPLRCKSRAWCNHIGDEAKARAQGTKSKVKSTRRSSRQRWDAKWRSKRQRRYPKIASACAWVRARSTTRIYPPLSIRPCFFFFAVAPIVRTRDGWDESQGRNVSDDR